MSEVIRLVATRKWQGHPQRKYGENEIFGTSKGNGSPSKKN